MRNLRTLETEGMVNSNNDYQEIINAIAKVSSVQVIHSNIFISAKDGVSKTLHVDREELVYTLRQ